MANDQDAPITIKVIRNHVDAVVPSRAHNTDAGYDLTLISLIEKINDVEFYDTGIAIAPPPGHYVQVYARSSISKTGYMLANGVGIIDNGYRGNIKIALRKVNPNMPNLALPCVFAQMIPVRMIDTNFELCKTLDDTARGTGGFGSTSL